MGTGKFAMFARISEDHVAFSFKDNAPRILAVLGVLQRTRTANPRLKQTNAMLKRAMTTRHGGRGKRVW